MAKPGVFAEIGFHAALKKAKKQGKLLVVAASASWCMPCHRMDETTWSNPKTVQWLNEHSIAIQFDVDEEPELNQQLAVDCMPTTLVFRKGVFFDRLEGAVSPDTLLGFLRDSLNGKNTVD